MFRKTLLGSALAAASLSALAADYYIVTPVAGRTAMTTDVQVTLNAAALPAGLVGYAYDRFALSSLLTVTGDPSYTGGGVQWLLTAGSLPAGMTLNADGSLSGTPTVTGSFPVTLLASYRGKSASQSYTLTVTPVYVVATSGGTRTWADGTLAASCLEYRNGKRGYEYAGATGDGVYRIDVDGSGPLPASDVRCDMTTEGGGWTVFQDRFDGSVDFYRNWAAYAAGFGSASGEYWLANDRLAALTTTAKTLRIEMARTNGQTGYARYSSFKISTASDKYRLTVSGFTGNVGDSLISWQYVAGTPFTTYDVDNDVASDANCAVKYHGAWWYRACHTSNLNGTYLNGPHASYADGMEWVSWSGYYESLARTRMMVR